MGSACLFKQICNSPVGLVLVNRVHECQDLSFVDVWCSPPVGFGQDLTLLGHPVAC